MRLRNLGLFIVVVAVGVWGYKVSTTRPGYDPAQIPLTGVLKRQADVFAVTPDGLFRAMSNTRQWTRLATPPELPLGGRFATLPTNSSTLIYVANHPSAGTPGLIALPAPSAGDPQKYGLYLSRDDGATWTRMTDGDDFGDVLLLPDGKLFAVNHANGYGKPSTLLQSPDLGKNWRDITGNLTGSVLGIFPDPDHPGLVCVRLDSGIRMSEAQATDETYQWQSSFGKFLLTNPPRPEDFFQRTDSRSSINSELNATLANYFDFDFDDGITRAALEIVPKGERFVFRQGDRVVIPIRVVLHQDHASEKALWYRSSSNQGRWPGPIPIVWQFIDEVDGTDLWGIRVEKDGQQVSRNPVHQGDISSKPEKADEAVLAKLLRPGDVMAVPLSAATPYERSIDLGRLYDFSKPGEYRVQLVYSSGLVVGASKGVWDGFLDSPVFRVVIEK